MQPRSLGYKEHGNVLIVCLYEMVEDHQKEEDDANDVGEHGQLDVGDHLGQANLSEIYMKWKS